MLGRHCLRTYSVTQAVVALSSAEAELLAVVRASSEAIGLCQLAASWGISISGEVFGDSSAALAIVKRRGCGKLRHVRVGHLWVQEASASGALRYHKVPGTLNPADLLTKHLAAPKAQPICRSIGQHGTAGGADKRLHLRSVSNSTRKRFNDTHRRIGEVGMHVGLQVDRIESARGLMIPGEELERLVYSVGPALGCVHQMARSEEGCLRNSCHQHWNMYR